MLSYSRGYFGIGIFHPKHDCNIGTLFRSAFAFNASFVFTIGRKYRTQSSDTPKSIQQIPYYHYLTYENFYGNLPKGCRIVCIEISEKARSLPNFVHPEQCIYLLGNEGNGIPEKHLNDKLVVQIPTQFCLNVSTAGSIVMYDRVAKEKSLSYETYSKN